jgi:chromosome segregation ATPase
MDWGAYAENLRNHSNLLIRNNRYLASDGSGGVGSGLGAGMDFSRQSNDFLGKHDNKSRMYDMNYEDRDNNEAVDGPISANNVIDINRNIAELKVLNSKINRKISTLESMLKDCGQLLDSNTDAQMSIVTRVDQIEHDVYSSMQSSSQLAKERSDLIIQTKQLLSRMSSLESHVQDIDGHYATKVSIYKIASASLIFC